MPQSSVNPNADYYDKIRNASVPPISSEPSAISISALTTTEKPLKLPPAPEQPDYLSALSAIPTIESLAPSEPSTAEKTGKTLRDRALSVMESLGMKTQRTIEAEKAAGLPDLNKQLAEVTSQIMALQKEAAAVPLQIQEESEGRGRTAAGVAPLQADLLRKNAIKALSLSAIAQTLQGNVALAQQGVDRAIELEFAPFQNELDYLGKLIEFNAEDISREDNKRTELFQARLQDRQRLLDEQKDTRNRVYSIALEAARNGADAATLNRIRDARTDEEAVALGGEAISAQFRQQLIQQQFQNFIAKRNLAINEAQLRLAQDRLAFEKQQKLADIESGVLTDDQIKAIDTSPQGKQLKTLGDLKLKAAAYQQLVKQYGTSSFGEQKAKLDAAYADLKIAYKTAAELGALQGPDIALLEQALKPATFGNPISQIFTKIGGGGVGSITGGLDQAISIIQTTGERNVTQLLARNPAYQNSSYVQALALPFIKQETGMVSIGDQQVPVGSIIQNDKGQKARVNADGTVTPI